MLLINTKHSFSYISFTCVYCPLGNEILGNLATSNPFLYWNLKIYSLQGNFFTSKARITHNTMDASRYVSSGKKLII